MRKFTESVHQAVTFENLNTLDREDVDLDADFEGCYHTPATYYDPAESDYELCVWDTDCYNFVVHLLLSGYSYKGETDPKKVFNMLEELLADCLTYIEEVDCEEF